MKKTIPTGAAIVILASACGPSAPTTSVPRSGTGKVENVTVASDAGASTLSIIAPTPSPAIDLARWVPGQGFEDIGDGARGAVVNGRRIVLRGGKATVIDAQAIPNLGRGQRLPKALGGGWIFVGDKSVHAGETFEGALRLITADLAADHGIGIGHDSVFSRGTMFELSTGKKRDLPVAHTEQIFGAPSGIVALRTGNGELFVSLGKGKPFTKVRPAGPVTDLAYDGKGIVVRSARGEERVGPDGSLAPRASEPGLVTSDNLYAVKEPYPDMSKPPPAGDDVDSMLQPLTAAMSERAVVAIKDGALVVYDGTTGKESSRQPNAFGNRPNCFPIRGGTPAFVACNDQAATTVFRIDAPDRPPVAERSFRGVYSQDFGNPPPDAPLALAKKCDGADVRGAFCVRKDDKTWVDVAPPPDPEKLLGSFPMVIHVGASADGAPYAFGWKGGNGDLVIIDGRGKSVRRIAKSDVPAWVGSGMRWDSVTIRAGAIRFLVPGAKPGVFEIAPDGHITGEPFKGHLGAIGARGLLLTPEGTVRETLDGGRTFRDVPPPPGGGEGRVFCVDAGCTIGPWHRVGWGP